MHEETAAPPADQPTPDTEQQPAPKPTATELLKEFDKAIAEEEFANYRRQEAEIRTRFADDVDRIRTGELASINLAVHDARRNLADLDLTPRVLLRLLLGIAGPGAASQAFGGPFIFFLVIVAILTLRTVTSWVGLLLSASIVVFFGVGSTLSIMSHRSRQRSVRNELQEIEGFYEQERARLVRESVRRQVTELFREAGIITFPMLAPTLVELSTAKIVSSRTHDEVIDFIRSHETSAIGIAGARGAGKSTLMDAVRNTDRLASHHVHLTAPVKYEPVDFIRRLFADAAKEILDRSGHSIESSHSVQHRRLFRQRLVRDVLAVGMLSILTAAVFLWSLDQYEWWDWQTAAGFAATAVLVIVVMSAAVSLVSTTVRSADSRAALFKVPRSVRLAVEALDDLVWSTEEGQKETGSFKLLGGMFTVGGEDNVTRKQREMTHPELVARFREMLTQFSRDRADERFVIFIDELDKLNKLDDLVEAINGIKDLLHLPGVHFVVSVSVDALVRFEERGMAARDAFDSAFDTVIRMRPLTLEESQNILASRAANFPAVLVLCCHAWSGGLARDLLRNARRCVEIHRRSSEVPHVSEIMVRMVTEDMTAHIENALRAAENAGHLSQLRRAVRAVADGADPLAELEKLDEASGQVDHVTHAGLALLAYIKHAPADERRWEQPPDDWKPTIEALAAAMAVRAEPAAIREEALRDAVNPVTST